MLSSSPEDEDHDFVEFAQKAELEEGYCKLTVYENPMIDEATRNRLMDECGGPESSTWLREYMCKRVIDSSKAIVAEWKDEYVQDVPRDEFYRFYHKYEAMDLGVRDNTAILFGYYDFMKAKLIIEDEWIMNGPTLTTETIRRAINEKEKNLFGNLRVYSRISDNNNPLLLQDLSLGDSPIYFSPTDKSRLEEMVNHLKILVRNGGLIVHPRCKNLIGCLRTGIWDNHRDKFAQSKVYGHYDALAALIYMVRNLDRSTNPIPVDYNLDRDNQLLFVKARQTDGAEQLKRAFNMT